MSYLVHLEGFIVPASKVPECHRGPEIYNHIEKSVSIGVFPINDAEVVVGRMTLFFEAGAAASLVVADFKEVSPIQANSKQHLEILVCLRELGPRVYGGRITYPWCRKLVLIKK